MKAEQITTHMTIECQDCTFKHHAEFPSENKKKAVRAYANKHARDNQHKVITTTTRELVYEP